MLDSRNSSSLSKNKKNLKSRRKLPFSEKYESNTSEAEPDSCDSYESAKSKKSRRKISPRTTPVSERQQIALLCKLSAAQSPSTENSLSSYEGDVDVKHNEKGETPLHKAAEKGKLEEARDLLKDGFPVNVTDNAGWTPLHEACNRGWYEMVVLLLKHGANINAVSYTDKDTPLHDAVYSQNEQIVQLLLDYGADPLLKNDLKQTPLDVAETPVIADILRAAVESRYQPVRDPRSLIAVTERLYQEHLLSSRQSKESTPKNVSENNSDRQTSSDIAQAPIASDVMKTISDQCSVESKQKQPSTSNEKMKVPTMKSLLEDQPHDTLDLSGQSEASPCHPPKVLCDPIMKKASLPNHTQKGAEKPTSPRLTLRFQSIKSKDDRSSSNAAKVSDSVSTSSSQPKYQSYCVTMEAKGDVYDLHKDDAVVSSTQNLFISSKSDEDGIKCNTVSCTPVNKETKECAKENSEEPSEANNKLVSVKKLDNSDVQEKEHSSDIEKEENWHKRKKGSDSIQSRHGTTKGLKSQSDSHNDQRIPKVQNKSGLSRSETESNPSDAETASAGISIELGNVNVESSASASPFSPKVPPLKIVIPSGTTGLELETRERNKVSSSKQTLPYVVNTTSSETIDTAPICDSFSGDGIVSKSDIPGKSKDSHHNEEKFSPRVTRSSYRNQTANSTGAIPKRYHRSGSVHSNIVSSSSQKKCVSSEISCDEQHHNSVAVHPRKRKQLRAKAIVAESAQKSSCASSSTEDSHPQNQPSNCYQMYMDIRRTVDKKRRAMLTVQPKPPPDFDNYLLNTQNYILEGNAASHLSVPMFSPPPSLHEEMTNLFIIQEKERYKLRKQIVVEKEKLILACEQEILRVHGKAARAMNNQTTPLSVCSILKDEEIYNTIEEDKDKNVRPRYNGRLFLSWMQDVTDKWEKLKNAMLLRHQNEAESMHAVQKLDWEWKMKELGLCDRKSSPVIDDIFVPLVPVIDDLDLHSKK